MVFSKAFDLYRKSGALIVIIIVLVGSVLYSLLGTNLGTSENPKPGKNIPAKIQSDNIDQQMVNTINQFRTDRGLSVLKVSSNLQNSAAWYAQDMATHNAAIPDSNPPGWKEPWNSHGDSLGRGIAQRIAAFGYPGQSTENIVYWGGPGSDSNVTAAMNSWLSSSGHVATMSIPNLVMIGVARYTVAYSAPYSSMTYWVADFGYVDDGTSGSSGGGGGNTCSSPKILDCGAFCHDPHDQPDGGGCCSSDVCRVGSSCLNNVCTPSSGGGGAGSCTSPNILDCGAFCHAPHDQPDGGGCCSSSICRVGSSCINNVCTPSSGGGGGGGGGGGNQNPTVTTKPTATNTPVPTATTAPSNGKFHISVILPGVGSNSALGENSNPTPNTVNGKVEILDANSQQNLNQSEPQLTFNSQNSAFEGDVPNIPAGTYALKVRIDNSLKKHAGTVSVKAGETKNISSVKLVTGDLNGDNRLDLMDYNILISCFGDKPCDKKQLADFNLDGKVSEKDLNIFYQALAKREGD